MSLVVHSSPGWLVEIDLFGPIGAIVWINRVPFRVTVAQC